MAPGWWTYGRYRSGCWKNSGVFWGDYVLPITNSKFGSENRCFAIKKKEKHIPTIHLQLFLLLVSGRVGMMMMMMMMMMMIFDWCFCFNGSLN